MSNTDLIREVDEELRNEQIKKLWEKYRGLLMAGAIAIVVVVGGYKLWQGYKEREAAAAGAQFDAATSLMAAGKPDEAAKALDAIAASGPAAYAALANLRLAAKSAADGKTDDAAARYDALAANANADATLRGYARLQSAQLKLDKSDFTAMQNQLNDLATPDGVWRNGARELLGLSAYKAGKLAEADDYFAAILADKDGHGPIGQLAQTMRELILAATAKPAAAK